MRLGPEELVFLLLGGRGPLGSRVIGGEVIYRVRESQAAEKGPGAQSVAKVSTTQTSCAQDSQRSLLNAGSDSVGLGCSLQFCISNRFSGDVIGDRPPNTLCTARV